MEKDSNDDVAGISLPKPVKKPWYIYLMTIWAFFGIGSIVMRVAQDAAGNNNAVRQYTSMAVVVILAVIVVNIIRMNKRYLVAFGMINTALAIWNTGSIVVLLLSGGQINTAVYVVLGFILVSSVMAFLSLRPTFLIMADKYRAYAEQEEMRKFSLKRMR